MTLRKTALAATLVASIISVLPSSAQAAWGSLVGWGGVGVGATGALIGGTIAASYYGYPYDVDGHYGYGYPDYDAGNAYPYYGYSYTPRYYRYGYDRPYRY
jgi:hypothetical protein